MRNGISAEVRWRFIAFANMAPLQNARWLESVKMGASGLCTMFEPEAKASYQDSDSYIGRSIRLMVGR